MRYEGWGMTPRFACLMRCSLGLSIFCTTGGWRLASGGWRLSFDAGAGGFRDRLPFSALLAQEGGGLVDGVGQRYQPDRGELRRNVGPLGDRARRIVDSLPDRQRGARGR